MEKYKILKDYPAYRIFIDGKLESKWQKGNRHSKIVYTEWHELKIKYDSNGYCCTALCDGFNKPKTFRIHNIVLNEFIGKKPVGLCVRHLDGNKKNNSLTNLCYGTYLENENDKHNNGTWGTRITNRKLSDVQIIDILNDIKLGVKDKNIAAKNNVSRPTITRIRNNKIWKR
jgi:hypothetical protein